MILVNLGMQFFSFTIKKDLSKTKNKIKGKNLLVVCNLLPWLEP
jgi:hypothetical protein